VGIESLGSSLAARGDHRGENVGSLVCDEGRRSLWTKTSTISMPRQLKLFLARQVRRKEVNGLRMALAI
jgi:hypothetical protein